MWINAFQCIAMYQHKVLLKLTDQKWLTGFGLVIPSQCKYIIWLKEGQEDRHSAAKSEAVCYFRSVEDGRCNNRSGCKVDTLLQSQSFRGNRRAPRLFISVCDPCAASSSADYLSRSRPCPICLHDCLHRALPRSVFHGGKSLKATFVYPHTRTNCFPMAAKITAEKTLQR